MFLNHAKTEHLSTMEQISISFSWLSAGLRLSDLLVLKDMITAEKDITRKLEKMGYSKDGTELGELRLPAVLKETDCAADT